MLFKLKIFVIFVLLNAFFTESKAFEDQFPSGITLRGYNLVNEYFPVLTKFADSILEAKSYKFFEKWTKEDLIILFESIFETGVHQSTTSEADFISGFEGAMSTIFGMIELRKRYPHSQGYVVVTDLVLDRLILYVYQSKTLRFLQNQIRKNMLKKTRHDGLVYRWEHEKFVIYQVFESKASGKYNGEQSQGVFERWQTIGLFIGGYHIKPSDIYFRSIHTGRLVHISDMNVNDFKQYIFLSHIKKIGKNKKQASFLGERFQVPYSAPVTVSHKNYKEIYEDFFMYLGSRVYTYILRIINRSKTNTDKTIADVIHQYYSEFIDDLNKEFQVIEQLLIEEDPDMIRFLDKNESRLLTYGFILPFFMEYQESSKITELMNKKFSRKLVFRRKCKAFFSDIDF